MLMLVVASLSLVAMLVDPRSITGAPAWLKPFKFAVSTAVYCLTLAWVFEWLPERSKVRRVVGWTTAVVFVLEVATIDAQAWRGTTSHFNVSTTLDGTLFMVMGLAMRGLFDWSSVVVKGTFYLLDPEIGSPDTYRRAHDGRESPGIGPASRRMASWTTATKRAGSSRDSPIRVTVRRRPSTPVTRVGRRSVTTTFGVPGRAASRYPGAGAGAVRQDVCSAEASSDSARRATSRRPARRTSTSPARAMGRSAIARAWPTSQRIE
jgi:hypothetical protein